MNIYIHIEWTKRELDSNLLLATLAAEKGAEVFISDYHSFKFLYDKKLIKPGLFHSKSAVHGPNKQAFFASLKKNHFVITALDEESGLVHNDDNLIGFVNSRFTNQALELMDRIFCWGNYDYDILIEKFKKYSKKFIRSGSPRIDLWKKKLKPYWDADSKKINKKYVLISCTFGVINSPIALWKIYFKLRKEGYFDRNKNLKHRFIEQASQSLRLFYKFVDAVNFLTQNCKDIDFVIRPHPVENPEVWEHLLTKSENLIIEPKRPMSAVIRNAQVVIQNGCTTAYEATLNDIPVITYNPLPDEILHGKPANELGKCVNNLEDLKTQVQNIVLKNINIKDSSKKKEAEKKLNFNQEQVCSEIIIDNWLTLLKGYKKKNNWNLLFILLFCYQFIKKIIFNLMTFGKERKKIIGQVKFENKNKNYYQDKINRFKKIFNISSDIRIYKSVDNSFLIKKK